MNDIQIIGRGYLGTLLSRAINCDHHPLSLDCRPEKLIESFRVLIIASGPSSASINDEEARIFERKLIIFLKNIKISNKNIHIIYISSGGTVYGEGTGIPFKESNKTQFFSAYSKYHIKAERLIKNSHNGPVTTIRLSNAYGPSQLFKIKQGFISAVVRSAIMKQTLTIYGNGDCIRDYIHECDIKSAIKTVVHKPIEGTFNLSTGTGTTQKEIIRTVEEIFKTKIKVEYLPTRSCDLETNILCPDLFKETFNWNHHFEVREGIESYGVLPASPKEAIELISNRTLATH
jgi:UDP-glucose 4-epimerase